MLQLHEKFGQGQFHYGNPAGAVLSSGFGKLSNFGSVIKAIFSQNLAACEAYVNVWDMEQLKFNFFSAETHTGNFRGV